MLGGLTLLIIVFLLVCFLGMAHKVPDEICTHAAPAITIIIGIIAIICAYVFWLNNK